MEELLKLRQLDVNAVDTTGRTALLHAVERGEGGTFLIKILENQEY